MAKQKNSTVQTAIIGLAGSILTVCGGLCGALVTSAIAIYQVERENQQLEISSSGGEQVLSVDTGTILLSRQEAAALDADEYYINLEQGFVLRRPLPGWDSLEELTVEEQLAEANVTCIVACDQPVYRIRYGEPIEIESDRDSTINGNPVPPELLDLNEQLYGPPPWKAPYYSQMILNVFDKSVVESLGVENLPEFILMMTQYQSISYSRMVAQPDSHFAILQGANTLAGIHIDGEPASLTLDDWVLYAETDSAYYVVEIAFTAQSGQSVQVWDNLQTYIEDFRVIE